jgi:general stress protein 26
MALNEQVRAFLQKPLTAYMAVIDTNGYPHNVPVWFGNDGDDILIFSDRETRKVRSIQANPKGAITIGGDPAGAECYLFKGDFSIEDDVGHRWTREITYRYEPKEQADQRLAEWANDDIVVLRLRVNKVTKIA